MTPIEEMTVEVPVAMAATIRQAVESGDYLSPSEVLRDALRDWRHKRQMQQQEAEQRKAEEQQGTVDRKAGNTKPAKDVPTRLENSSQAAGQQGISDRKVGSTKLAEDVSTRLEDSSQQRPVVSQQNNAGPSSAPARPLSAERQPRR